MRVDVLDGCADGWDNFDCHFWTEVLCVERVGGGGVDKLGKLGKVLRDRR